MISKQTWSENEHAMERIFFDLWNRRIANAYVIATAKKDENQVAKLYTFFPYNERSCSKADPVLVNEYRKDGFASELEVFVDKFKNMHRCWLTIVTSKTNPYIYLRTGVDGEKYMGGIEGDIVLYLARAMNFKTRIQRIPNANFYTDIREMVWLVTFVCCLSVTNSNDLLPAHKWFGWYCNRRDSKYGRRHIDVIYGHIFLLPGYIGHY